MRFLLVTGGIKAGSGGAQRVVSLFCNELAKQGHDVMLILYEKHTSSDYYISDKVCVESLPKNNDGLGKCAYYYSKMMALRKKISSFAPDVIVPFLADPMLHVYIATRGTVNRNRILTTVRNNPKVFPQSKKLRIRNNILIALNRACFFQNAEQQSYYPRFIQKKSFILPNPVMDELLDCNRYYRPIRKIVTLGRLSTQKNQKMLIEVMRQVVPDYPDIELNIYGKGELEGALWDLIVEYGLEKNVFLRGVISDVREALLENDLFVMTSDFEGMPNSLIEAMATGMPCISTDCPTGPSELIVEGENGCLIPMKDVNACIRAIRKMIDNPAAAREMGNNARITIAQKYKCSEIVARFVNYCRMYF